jgi:hypothetical protein
MRLWMTRRFRMKVAVAVLYAICALTPTAALAFTDSNDLVHCQSEAGDVAHGFVAQAASGHFHADGTWHEHHDGAIPHKHDGKAAPDNCCCAFCAPALANVSVVTLPIPEVSVPVLFAVTYSLPGRGPDRINRPPIA